MRRVSICGALLTAAALIVAPASASGAVTIGETFDASDISCDSRLSIQAVSAGPSYTVPADGVITSWSQQGSQIGVDPPDQARLKVARFAPGADPASELFMTIVGESAIESPSADVLNTFSTGIPVLAGDRIGFFTGETDGGSYNCQVGFFFAEGYRELFSNNDVPPGTSIGFQPQVSRLNVSAVVEPDCDKDGLGDDTQDGELLGPCSRVTSTATCKGELLTDVGTDGPDEISGTPERDVISGLGGKDEISGLAGKDLICGGKGKDTLRGGKGKDKLYGQGGKDRLAGGGGKDRCVGGKKDDSAKKCEVEKSI